MNHQQYRVGKLTFIDKSKMTKAQWIAMRLYGIGGSDISSILDLNPYASITQLFYEKIGFRDPENLNNNENVFWGSFLEERTLTAGSYFNPNMAERTNYLHNYYMNVKTHNIIKLDFIIKHDDYPNFLFNMDGVTLPMDVDPAAFLKGITEGNMIATPMCVDEAKSITDFNYDKWEKGLPIGYVGQVTGYMLPFKELNPSITSRIWALKAGNFLECFPIPWSDRLADRIIDDCNMFWEYVKEGKKIVNDPRIKTIAEKEHWLDQIAPRPKTKTPAYDAFLSKKLKEKAKKTIIGEDEPYQIARLFNVHTYLKKLFEEHADANGTMIKEYMDVNDALVLDYKESGRITWSKRLYTESIKVKDLLDPVMDDIDKILIKHKLVK